MSRAGEYWAVRGSTELRGRAPRLARERVASRRFTAPPDAGRRQTKRSPASTAAVGAPTVLASQVSDASRAPASSLLAGDSVKTTHDVETALSALSARKAAQTIAKRAEKRLRRLVTDLL